MELETDRQSIVCRGDGKAFTKDEAVHPPVNLQRCLEAINSLDKLSLKGVTLENMIRSLFTHYIEEQSWQLSAWKEELFKMVWDPVSYVTDPGLVKKIMSHK